MRDVTESMVSLARQTFEALSRLHDHWTPEMLVRLARGLEYVRLELDDELCPEQWELMQEVLATETVSLGDLMLLGGFTREKETPGSCNMVKQDLQSGLISKYYDDCDAGSVERISRLLNFC
ncbi:hypothetical protein KIPB_002021 [Kipferlia bialata]|uniref:Uncharacterized protein n=1 Tax=Kipferlia bialata TaxID=797122 RepID=A0A9K3CRP2_9EUKA|nr:hypothetical protein KIPB_002021 [Kipferlia bialata]|eukprot:g2021.t1